jgi:membrane protease YdiL (CAAX protease family)
LVAAIDVFGLDQFGAPPAGHDDAVTTQHPLETLIREGGGFWLVALGVLSAILVAPVVEEIVFRLIVQGWLESLEIRARRSLRELGIGFPGLTPMTLTAVLFAAVHYRVAGPAMSVHQIGLLFLIQAAAGAGTLGAILLLTAGLRRANWEDLGFVPKKLLTDVKTGLLACLAIAPPVYVIFIVARKLLPGHLAVDPIPLLLLALALGLLYFRTHRIVPSIVLHMSFNGISVLFGLLAA